MKHKTKLQLLLLLGQDRNSSTYSVFCYLLLLYVVEIKETVIMFCMQNLSNFSISSKVQIFSEGHKVLRNLQQLLVLCTANQIIGGDLEKFCGILRIYELYCLVVLSQHIRYLVGKQFCCSLQ